MLLFILANNRVNTNILVMDGAGEIEATSIYKASNDKFEKNKY